MSQMSVNFNRAYTNKCVSRKEYLRKQINLDYPPYWDEGVMFYPKWRRGYKNPNKTIMSYQIRMYKSWKHNRKTQWKK